MSPNSVGSENVIRFLAESTKKNLKELFIVQPTNLVKTLVKLFKPFISSKFWHKLHYVNDMKALYQYMSPQQIQLPITLNASGAGSPRVVVQQLDKPTKGEIFGRSLDHVMQHPMNAKEPMPLIVANAIRYLSVHGPKTEGIFRLSGKRQKLDDIKAAYDRGQIVDFSGESDVHAIAGLLKGFIRELPDPILPFNVYNKWIGAFSASDLSGTKSRMKQLLKNVPSTNLVVLSALMGLCVKISLQSQDNKMTPQNLAICWGPNILKSREVTLTTALLDAGTVNSIVSLFILHYDYFFLDL